MDKRHGSRHRGILRITQQTFIRIVKGQLKMLRFEYIPGNEEAQKIIKAHINNRLIALMEGIILDEVDWNLAMHGELENIPEDASFEDLADVDALMNDMDFAENVSMSYLPDNYPIEKANREFFGLYKLLKAKNEYVPELPMEYVLYSTLVPVTVKLTTQF